LTGNIGSGQAGGVEAAGLVDPLLRMHAEIVAKATDRNGDKVPPVGFEPTLYAV
jgi:hypothetical protein